MNVLDIFFLVILAIISLKGLYKGFVREGCGLAGLVFGFWAGCAHYPEISPLLKGVIETSSYRDMAAFLILFFGSLVLFSILGLMVKRLINMSSLRGLDTILGGLLGLLKGVLVLVVLTLILISFLPPRSPLLGRSQSAPYLVKVSGVIASIVPDKLKRLYQDNEKNLIENWKKTPLKGGK
ncbi:MAG: CvpA family protein [Deltaproteobacteria bacterium]|nr:CvpA family protein [Deltaproteobacteria bacterium]